ncbi:MAG: hypothetical protein EOR45_28080 [Mesorhizobium sp.]|nr:MAG: hypothetical protein EOR45_28080 [Mesorhizobium sp.]
MEEIQKRRVGRPIGSGVKNNDQALVKVASILLDNPSMKATSAMRRVLNDMSSSRRETDVTLIRRWQGRWKLNRQKFMNEAAATRAARTARAPSRTTSSISDSASEYLMRKAKETASMYNFSEASALQKAAAGYLDTPLRKEVHGVLDSLALRTALGLHESSIQRELRRMTDSTVMERC